MIAGRRLLCLYVGEALWHERLLLKKCGPRAGVWAVVSPEGDVYVEEYGDTSCFRAIRMVPVNGGRPSGVTGKIHPFRGAPPAAQLGEWHREARAAVSEWLGGVPALTEMPEPAEVSAAPSVSAEERPVVSKPMAASAFEVNEAEAPSESPGTFDLAFELPAAAGHDWYASQDSTCGGVSAGALLADVVVEGKFLDGHGIFKLEGGGTVLGELWRVTRSDRLGERARHLQAAAAAFDAGTPLGEVGPDTPRQPPPDARCLSVRTVGGRRHREWANVTDESSPITFEGWPIEGPRATQWVVQFLARAGSGGPEGYHKWWRTVCRLGPADWGVSEHGQLCRYLHLGASWDQLDVTNLAVFEAITRRLQLVEYQYRERSREGARGGAQGGLATADATGLAVMDGFEADLFDGIGRVDGVVCCAPILISWISEELRKTSEIDKNARKAREERAFQRGTHDLVQPQLVVPVVPKDGKGKNGKKGG